MAPLFRGFVDNFPEVEQALRKDHPGVFDSEQDEQGAHELAVFRRKWLCKKNPIFPAYVDSRAWVIGSPDSNRLLVRLSLFICEKFLATVMLTVLSRLSCYCDLYCEIGFTTRMLGGKIFLLVPSLGYG